MHLTTETALDLLGGRLHKDQEAFWKQHMQSCNNCTTDVQQWQQLTVDLKLSRLMGASEKDLANAMHIFSPTFQGSGSTVRTLLASIVFDSFLQPALAGIRGSSQTGRQIVMRVDEFDIHVKIWGENGRKQMLGQLLPRNGKELVVQTARFHLLRSGERLESTTMDEMGEFHFSDVPEGDLSLQIDLPNLTVIGALNLQGTV